MLKDINQNKIDEILNTKKCLLVNEFEKQEDKQKSYCRIKRANEQFLALVKYKE